MRGIALTGDPAQSNAYNGLDDWVSATNGSTTHTFIYDADGRVLGEYGTSAADVIAETIWLSPEVANDNQPFGGDDGVGGIERRAALGGVEDPHPPGGAGVLTLLPTSQVMIDSFGWRGTYHVVGGVLLLLIVPLVLLPWRRIAKNTVPSTASSSPHLADEGLTLLHALRHHAFWALFSTFFFTAIGMYAIAVQVVAYLVEVGFPPLQAATAWGLSGVVLVVGMLTVSWLDSLIGRRQAILFSYGLTTIGIGFLWLLHRYPNLWLLGGFLLCFGSTIGSRGPLITAAAINIFRGKRVGTIFGTISIGSGLGSALGSLTGGIIHDWSHSYDLVILFALVNVLLGMIPFLTVRALRE